MKEVEDAGETDKVDSRGDEEVKGKVEKDVAEIGEEFDLKVLEREGDCVVDVCCTVR